LLSNPLECPSWVRNGPSATPSGRSAVGGEADVFRQKADIGQRMSPARISQLQEAAAQRNEVTLDEVISMLRKSYEDAKAAKQHGPAVRAAELLGRYMGLFKDRLLVTDTARLSDDQLIEALGQGDPERERAAQVLLGQRDGFPEADEPLH